MSESMVERVALAIKRHQLGAKAELATEGPWLAFELDSARAAIEAMREPTDTMEVAGGLKCETLMFEGDGSGVIFKDMGQVYRAMIDAALEEGKQ